MSVLLLHYETFNLMGYNCLTKTTCMGLWEFAWVVIFGTIVEEGANARLGNLGVWATSTFNESWERQEDAGF